MRSNLEPSIQRHPAIHGGDGHRLEVLPSPESAGSTLATSKQVLGGLFRFESNSRDLIDVVEAAYGGLPSRASTTTTVEFLIEMRLLPRSANSWSVEPPAPQILSDGDHLRAEIDASNHVTIEHARRRAQIVVSMDMLLHAYHLRCELIEFAVYTLATRALGLAPLHAACVGRHGRGLLLLGSSGSGKSTLALHALLRGLDLLAEDAVLVHPATLVATGVPSYLHLRGDALDFVEDDAVRAWVAHAAVIRRRSGVEKFEVDLRRGWGRPAVAPLALVGAVFVSAQPAEHPDALLTRLHANDVDRLLDADQPYASSQPGWTRFKREITDMGVHQLRRGRHPRDAVDALCRLLD